MAWIRRISNNVSIFDVVNSYATKANLDRLVQQYATQYYDFTEQDGELIMLPKGQQFFNRANEAINNIESGNANETQPIKKEYTINNQQYFEQELLSLYRKKYPNKSDDELLKAIRKLK